jgi:hypothetical protein
MQSVLLTHSNHLYSDPKQVQKMQPYPPLQTILVASVLRANGMHAHLFDPTFEYSEQGFRSAIDRVKPDLIVVCEDDFNFLHVFNVRCGIAFNHHDIRILANAN